MPPALSSRKNLILLALSSPSFHLECTRNLFRELCAGASLNSLFMLSMFFLPFLVGYESEHITLEVGVLGLGEEASEPLQPGENLLRVDRNEHATKVINPGALEFR